ncbi:MAG: aspartate aminotransferase family protein [Promethearchaeota archaeon]|jgi:4-aminobutyrate aminotransferase-like enzyme
MDENLIPKDLCKTYSVDEILSIERQYMIPAVTHYYQDPVLIVGGEGATVKDYSGKQYIDLFSGICTKITGHHHPKFVATLKWQIDQLIYTSTLYSTVPYAVLSQKLAQIAPSGLTQTFIVNSGSEANEAALYMARKYKENPYIVACTHAYHGRTQLAREISSAGWRTVPESHPSGVRFTPYGYCYRCVFGKSYPDCDIECARYLREVIRTQTNNAIAAFIVEPIQGVGGIIQPPHEFFQITYEIIKEYDGLFISDEVQTGFGRTGNHWWGIQNNKVNPDIITMAKSFGSGIPIAGFLTKPEYAENFTTTDSFTTFGGNPLSCAAAVAVIEIIQEEDYIKKAKTLGENFKKQLLTLKSDHKIVGDIRGQGMMLGIELVSDQTSKKPATQEMLQVMELCREQGLLIGKGGIDGNVIRIQPPLELTNEQVENSCQILDYAFNTVEKKL